MTMLLDLDATLRTAMEALPGWEPDPLLTVSQWADQDRVLSSRTSPEPGPWRTDRTPYLRAIMDAMGPLSPYHTVVCVKCAQIGFSDCACNVIGYYMRHCPAPILAVLQNVDPMARRFSRSRIDSMIEASPALRDLVRDGEKEKGNTILEKVFPGGLLALAGANSAAGLRSQAVRVLILDEVDAYPASADDEGDPVELAKARTSNFSDRRKVMLGSTPTVRGVSRIELEAFGVEEDGEWHGGCDRIARYHVPCPSCFHLQPLEWKRLDFRQAPPVYRCAACEVAIPEHAKPWMLADRRPEQPDVVAAKWVLERDRGSGSIAFVGLNALYSPLGLGQSWPDLAEQWAKAQKDPKLLRVFVNTRLGEAWVERYEQPPWRVLYERRDGYSAGIVPAPPAGQVSPWLGPVFLTAGVDVQADRLEVELVAWGAQRRSWSVTYLRLDGDPQRDEVWAQLDRVLAADWPTAWGTTLPIRVLAIDSGYATTRVYAWARKHRQPAMSVASVDARHPRTVMVVKGVDGWGKPLVGKAESVEAGKRRRGLAVFPAATWTFKRDLYDALRLFAPSPDERAAGAVDPPGFARFPEYAEGWVKGLTSERLVRKQKREEWEVAPGVRNEPLDARVYAMAAAELVLVGTLRAREARLARLMGEAGLTPEAVAGIMPEEPVQTKARANVSPESNSRQAARDVSANAPAIPPPGAAQRPMRRRPVGVVGRFW